MYRRTDEGNDVTTNEAELWTLIDERMKPGADLARIDATIWERFGQTWAVMFTDLTGFSRMVAEFGIIHFLQEIHEQRALFLPIVAAHDGLLLKEEADSMLLLFADPARAIACGVAMNRRSHEANRDRAPEDKVLLCLGIGYGPMLRVGDRDVFGQEVNAASKLGEDTAKAGEIMITEAVRVAAGRIDGIAYEPLDVRVAGANECFRVRYAL
jgi:adenylate cyclase